MRNFSIKNTKWLNKGHELDYIATLILRPENNFYLIGSEDEIRNFFNRIGKKLADKNAVKGIVLTEYAEKIGGGVNIPIVRDVDIPREISTIIVCTSYDRSKYETIQQLFENYGFEENRQFFQGEIFAMIYEVYALNRITIDRIEIFMTSFCSLKCEKCIAYIPYFKKCEHTSIEQLKSDADLLFSKVDFVYKFKALGGEGFMYPHLIEYIDYVGTRYGDKIGSFRIGSNGTIYPSQELLDICKQHRVMIDISDYTGTIGNRSKLDKVKRMCIENGVAVDVKRTGEQWLDMGFPNNLPGEKDEEQLKRHFSKCAMFCRNFNDGKFYYCCSNFAAMKAGIYPESDNDFFDFTKDFTKRELLEYELGYSDLGHTTFCKVCRGCSDEVNPFHVEVAGQVNQ